MKCLDLQLNYRKSSVSTTLSYLQCLLTAVPGLQVTYTRFKYMYFRWVLCLMILPTAICTKIAFKKKEVEILLMHMMHCYCCVTLLQYLWYVEEHILPSSLHNASIPDVQTALSIQNPCFRCIFLPWTWSNHCSYVLTKTKCDHTLTYIQNKTCPMFPSKGISKKAKQCEQIWKYCHFLSSSIKPFS